MKIISCLVAALVLAACTEEKTYVVEKKTKAAKKPETAENFRAVEKPDSYTR